ncbi:MAG: hypothetical protein QNJ71_10220 [Acidimicrobiia bacterium]|nr:hypothetical protein [Acidimicrobiia bacterium]
MNEFEKFYQEDLEAVELKGVTFYVKLPGKANKRFQRTVIASTVKMDPESGEYVSKDVSLVQMAEIQIKAFAETSIRKVEGWDGYTIEKLLAMPDACEDLWSEVVKITNQKEGEADAETKKPANSSDGKTSGQARKSLTPNLQSAAS